MRFLSPAAAYFRERDNEGREWNTSEELLALIAEMIDGTNRLLYRVYAPKEKGWKPLAIPRPYEKRKIANATELRSFLHNGSGQVQIDGEAVE